MITKDTRIDELFDLNPDVGEVLAEYGMHCLGCLAAAGETLGEACAAHGIDIDELLAKLNETK
jgi:hydroxylamine reductase